ncbi:hypothetical protein VNI00_018222 [Paramarasmius palmivorus]|uniref:F-box domain-containing protein n=1 Tax=Paramarasmius palmivorus TaxID=297713 RepID=A0AAW0AZ42_9AGAR
MQETVAVRLPQEVLDTILKNLHPEGDIQTLVRCALTARCLVTTAQRILFREVRLSERVDRSERNHPIQFLGFLKHSPHLTKYISELELDIIPSRWGDNLSQNALTSILPRLQSLKKVSIKDATVTDACETVTSLQISTLLGGTAMPKINSLTLQYTMMTVHEIFAICDWLAAHGGLQDLHFLYVHVSDLIGPPPSTPPQAVFSCVPIQLRRFTIYNDSRFAEALLPWATGSASPLRFNALRELTVGGLPQESSVYLLRILDMAKNTLSCLRFTGETPSLSSFQFGTYRHLRCIIYDVDSLTFQGAQARLNEWCIALKESGELKLESFGISFSWDPPLGHDYPWRVLEDALISSRRCAHLVLQIYSSERIDVVTIQECFPQLHASDVCDLVVMNMVRDSLASWKYDSWEYTSRSGEWKSIPIGNSFFD